MLNHLLTIDVKRFNEMNVKFDGPEGKYSSLDSFFHPSSDIKIFLSDSGEISIIYDIVTGGTMQTICSRNNNLSKFFGDQLFSEVKDSILALGDHVLYFACDEFYPCQLGGEVSI